MSNLVASDYSLTATEAEFQHAVVVMARRLGWRAHVGQLHQSTGNPGAGAVEFTLSWESADWPVVADQAVS